MIAVLVEGEENKETKTEDCFFVGKLLDQQV